MLDLEHVKLTYDHLKRKFDHMFLLGLYPEISFYYHEQKYLIHADLKYFYLKKMSEDIDTIAKSTTFEELAQCGKIEGKVLKNIWPEIVFQDYESEYCYTYAYLDAVFLKTENIYGTIKEIVFEDGEEKYWFVPEGIDWLLRERSKWKLCTASELEYDERPHTIEKTRDSYQCYLERVGYL